MERKEKTAPKEAWPSWLLEFVEADWLDGVPVQPSYAAGWPPWCSDCEERPGPDCEQLGHDVELLTEEDIELWRYSQARSLWWEACCAWATQNNVSKLDLIEARRARRLAVDR